MRSNREYDYFDNVLKFTITLLSGPVYLSRSTITQKVRVQSTITPSLGNNNLLAIVDTKQ